MVESDQSVAISLPEDLRGQFERLEPTDSFGRFMEQVWIYGGVAVKGLG